MRDFDSDPSLVGQYERLARYGAIAVACLGVLVLIGWKLDITVLKSVLPGWATMKPDTAISFLLSGIALLLVCRSKAGTNMRSARVALAATVVALGLLALGQYAWNIDFGIDKLLFAAFAESPEIAAPGHMSKAAAIAFTLTGLALLCLCHSRSL